MSARELLFDGHVMVEVAPSAFKVKEPFSFDASNWLLHNAKSGTTLFCRQGKLYAVSYNHAATRYIKSNFYKEGDFMYVASPPSLLLGGLH